MAPSDGNVRIGTSEREDAVRALAEHMTQGRLDVSEYDQRVALANAAKTRAELAEIFEDLPEPNPVRALPVPVPAQASPLVEKEKGSNAKAIIIGFVIFSVAAIITVTAILGEWWALIPAFLIVVVLAIAS
ncbi:DUF1707 domain-containing protein [Kibdelosporangium philippinense]|uniref:DUF1707 domain-containing protein n=1 Tax=Kibdelosporangium philippinense TaxID=211113 RepID=A0ABS8ZDU5_9PSEU|nr:DUF1707 domain-containing protein [Kibdelosporangium philippinense]MCE7005999.1 DUF1707 domain-containing protein [Kibdelosporangium philippinense]